MSTYLLFVEDFTQRIQDLEKNILFLNNYTEGYDTEKQFLDLTNDHLQKARQSMILLNAHLKPKPARAHLELD